MRHPSLGPAARPRGIPLAITLALAGVLAACGGSKKEAEEPAEPSASSDTHRDDGAALVPQETMDEIRRTFHRRTTVVGRCYVEGLEAGEIERGAKGYVTVGVTILPSGDPSDIEILESTLRSRTLHDCLIGHVKRWTFATVPQPYKTSYQYRFEEF